MRDETVVKIIDEVSAGNGEFRWVLRAISIAGRDQIAKFPERDVPVVAGRLVHAAGLLTRERMDVRVLLTQGENFWKTERGVVAQKKIHEFVEVRAERVRQRQQGSRIKG